MNLSFENDRSSLVTVAGIVKNKVITVTSWKLQHMTMYSHINKVNNLETVEMFSRSDLKYCQKDSN
jgi:hypothetical protein